jgi:hypothetical protein
VVSGVLGLNVDCGTACQPIPLNVLTCITGCPSIVGPSFTKENVLWGYSADSFNPLCKKSVDSGRTWSNCPDVNFSTIGKPLLNSIGSITEAVDGSVIAVVTDMTSPSGLCTVVRSINGGATWSIVFQSSILHCAGSVGHGADDTNHLVCLNTGECVLVFEDEVVDKGRVIRSVDNGQTWDVVFNQTTSSDTLKAVAYNGSVGIACKFADSVTSPFTRGMKFNGVWTDSSFLSTTNVYCQSGAFIFNNVPYIAGVRGAPPTDRVIVDGLSGAVVTPIVLSGISMDPAITGTIAAAYKNKAIYIGASDAANGNKIGVWASLSLSGPYTKIFTGLPGMGGVNGGGGFVHPVSNCVYLYNRFNVVGFCP